MAEVVCEKMLPKIAPHLTGVSQKDLLSSYGNYHTLTRHSINITGKPFPVSFITVSTITGCGLVQMAGSINFGTLTKDELVIAKNDLYTRIIPMLKADGVGAILATLGQSHYKSHDNLLALGFVQVNEFSNYRHGQGGNYKQRIYLLTY